jgi:hypothetical protein
MLGLKLNESQGKWGGLQILPTPQIYIYIYNSSQKISSHDDHV